MNVIEKEVVDVVEMVTEESEGLAPSLLEMVAGGDATVNCF